jgi:hypothetical protein
MMRRFIYIAFIMLLASCKEKEAESYLTNEKAAAYFGSIKLICDQDNGRLWGTNLYGPIMFIDRTSRKIIANEQDKDGLLKGKDGVFTGVYPKELLIRVGPATFGGTRFAMAPLPTEEEDFRIKSRAVRSLYRCFAENAGFPVTAFNINNMDDKEARLWIKLEWKALRKAIATEGETRQLALRDALIFRGSNRELYQKWAEEATRFETNEGLATFTSTLLSTSSLEEFKTRILENLDRVYSMQSYSRSYGFIHGALYASFLYEKGFDFRTIKSDSSDLGIFVQEQYNIELPAICRDIAGSLAVSYDIDLINNEEEQRLEDIRASIHKQISIFTEKPVVFLELESPYFDFEPEDVHSLDTLGTLYTSMRVSDNWGKLTVNKEGCLVSSNFRYIRITARGFREEKNRLSGDGWQLMLNNDWVVVKVEQNYFVRKLMP